MKENKQESLEERATENANNLKKYEPYLRASLSLTFMGGFVAETATIVLLSNYLQSKGYSPDNSLLLSSLSGVVAGLAYSVPGLLLILHYTNLHYIKKDREIKNEP